MTDREKLIELMTENPNCLSRYGCFECPYEQEQDCYTESLVDYLIANGVTVQMSKKYPCVYYDNEKCKKFSGDGVTSWCVLGPCGEQVLSNADYMVYMIHEGDVGGLVAMWEEIFEDGVPCDDYMRWWLKLPVEVDEQ